MRRRVSGTNETTADWADAPLAAPPRGVVATVAERLDLERVRFFLWAPVCLGAGIAAYFALPREPNWAAASAPFAIAVIVRLATSRGTLASVFVNAVLLASMGFAIAKARVESVRAPVLEKTMRNVEVAGRVLQAESRGKKGQRLTIAVESIGALTAEARPARVRIRTLSDGPRVEPGDGVRLKATLAPPAKPALPGAFDYARTAWFERIGGVGYAFAKPVIEKREQPLPLAETALRSVQSVRAEIATRVRAALPGESGAIATALITGERGGISAETNEIFKNSGLFHILSISGLHMVVMAGAVFYIFRLTLAALPGIALRFSIKKIAAIAGIIAAFAYLALSGGAFATVRAAITILIMFTAVLLDRPALAMRNVALAALVILAIYPESLFDAGFQMSFAAVTALVAAYEGVNSLMRRRAPAGPVRRGIEFFTGIVASTLIASIAVAPFAAYHFHQSQQYAVLANMIAIPISNFIVMPMALLALMLMPFGLESLALAPMGAGIDAMTACARVVAALPGAVGRIPAIPTTSFALMALGGLWLTLWSARWRLLGFAGIAAGVLIAPTLPRPDILIARDGALIAMRLADGRLSALPARSSAFELQNWLNHDGDSRSPREAQRGEGFSCDTLSCVATIKGVALAAPRHAAALIDDCVRADLIVLTTPKPKSCATPATAIDLFSSWRDGGYAIFINADGDGARPQLRIETVAEFRGERPWSQSRIALPTPRISGASRPESAANARPFPLESAGADQPRPDVEDDDFDLEPAQ